MFHKNKELTLLLAGMVSVMASCQKEEIPADKEAPKVSLKISGNTAKLYNEVVLFSTPTDNGAIDRVVFFVDDDLISEVTEEPYEIKWNTKEVEDGPYLLKAVAYDANGNKGEAAQEATINNTLLVVNNESGVPQLMEGEERDSWIFLSDKNGNVVGEAKELIPGTTLRWERPLDFFSDTIYLNHLIYNSYDSWYSNTSKKRVKNFNFYTYTNFGLEEINNKIYNRLNSFDEIKVTVENDFDGSKEYLYSTAFFRTRNFSSTKSNTVTYSVGIYEERSQKAFNTYQFDDFINGIREKYYRLDDFQAGSSYKLHTSQFTAMEEHSTTSFPFEYKNLAVASFGFTDAEPERKYLTDGFNFRNSEAQEAKLFYTTAFPVIFTSVNVRTGNKTYKGFKKGKAPEVISLPDFSASVVSEKMKNIKVSSNGNFDVAAGGWIYSEESATDRLSLRRDVYFSSQSGVTYILPEIPTFLMERYPELRNQKEMEREMVFAFTYTLDNENLTSYEDIMKYWFTDSFTGVDYQEYSSYYFYPENPGGRIHSSQPDKTIQEMMNEEDFKSRGIFRNY